MSLEAWGDENPADRGPWRDCPDCDGDGELQGFDNEDRVIYLECPRCYGSGQILDEYDPLPDDVI